MPLNRREFLLASGIGSGALALSPAAGSRLSAATHAPSAGQPGAAGLPANWRAMRKWDAHNHVFTGAPAAGARWTEVENLIEAADALGIERLYCSRPITAGLMADIALVREYNDTILAAMGRFPGRIFGYCFLQPGNGTDALAEIDRCLARGMMGVKLYNQFKYTHPAVFPIAERCIERGIPLLGHSAFLTDPRTLAAQPNTSHALEFCSLARRYPELMLILGHVNGGGDWEWAIKGLRECESVFLDTSGSVLEDDTIGLCVRELGHRRVLFATDGTIEGGVGKALSAELTEAQREDILWRNLDRILKRRRA